MLVNLLLLSGLFLGVYLSWKLYEDVFTPLCVYVTVWCVCLLLFHLRIFVDYYPLQPKTALLFAVSILTFSGGCVLAGGKKQTKPPVMANLRRFEFCIKVLIGLSSLGLILFAMRMDSIYGLATYFVDPAILREDFENWPRIGVLAALVLLNYPLVICCLLYTLQTKKIKWFTCLGFLLACAQSHLLTDRVTVVVFLVTGTFVWMYLKGWQKLSPSVLIKLGVVVALMVGYFVANGKFFGRLVSTDSHTSQMQYLNAYSDLDLLLANPYMYATGPFITMQQAMAKTPDRLWGIRTFFPVAASLRC
jgi:oligosaccharide repeat unit polymerase